MKILLNQNKLFPRLRLNSMIQLAELQKKNFYPYIMKTQFNGPEVIESFDEVEKEDINDSLNAPFTNVVLMKRQLMSNEMIKSYERRNVDYVSKALSHTHADDEYVFDFEKMRSDNMLINLFENENGKIFDKRNSVIEVSVDNSTNFQIKTDETGHEIIVSNQPLIQKLIHLNLESRFFQESLV